MIELEIAPHAAIASFVSGAGSEDMAYTLANVMSLAMLIARSKPAAMQALALAGRDAVKSVLWRGKNHGVWGFTGGEYQAVKAAVTLYDELQAGLTRRQLRDTIKELSAML